MEPPAGPVLLGVPFECMLDEVALPEDSRANRVVRTFAIDDQAIQEAVEMLLRSDRPVLVTEHVGRDSSVVGPLVALCESLGIPVMESFRPAFLNFPRTHALYLPLRFPPGGIRRFGAGCRRCKPLVSGKQGAETHR